MQPCSSVHKDSFASEKTLSTALATWHVSFMTSYVTLLHPSYRDTPCIHRRRCPLRFNAQGQAAYTSIQRVISLTIRPDIKTWLHLLLQSTPFYLSVYLKLKPLHTSRYVSVFHLIHVTSYEKCFITPHHFGPFYKRDLKHRESFRQNTYSSVWETVTSPSSRMDTSSRGWRDVTSPGQPASPRHVSPIKTEGGSGDCAHRLKQHRPRGKLSDRFTLQRAQALQTAANKKKGWNVFNLKYVKVASHGSASTSHLMLAYQ